MGHGREEVPPDELPRPREAQRDGAGHGDRSAEVERPVVIAVCSDTSTQEDLVRRLAGAAVVVLVPDLRAAGALLVQLESSTTAARGIAAGPLGLLIDERRQQVTWQGVEIPLTRHEHDLLALMAADPGRVWTHEHLHLAVWKTRFLTNASDLHSSVKRLRRKLEATGVPVRIEAVRGVGFRLSLHQGSAARPPPG